MKPLIIACLLFTTLPTYAQHTSKKKATPPPAAKPIDDDDDTTGNWMVRGDPEKFFSGSIFTYVDQMPVCPYGIGDYLSAHLHYPDSARVHNKEGRVVIKFVVDTIGQIKDPTVVKGFDSSCDAEALRVVSGMPPWKPGANHGKPVQVYFTLPIMFKLTD